MARALRTDGEATYRRILEAAGTLFAEKGLAETPSKEIALKAGADLASINYHFGNRAGLYQAVLLEAHRSLITVAELQQLQAEDMPARARLRRLIETVVEHATTRQGWHVQVLSREILSPSSHLEALQETEIATKLGLAVAIFSEITGFSAQDPALYRCMASVMAPCALLMVARLKAPPIADQVVRGPREELIEHLYTFAVGGLEAVSARFRSDAGA